MSSDNLQVPPQAIEAEKAVLGSMLIEGDAVERGIEILDEKKFYKDSHRKVFGAILNLYQRSQAADIVTVGEELRKLKQIGEVGGTAYLKELISHVSTAAHVEHYAKIVRDKAILRDLIRVSTKAIEECYGEVKLPNELLDEVQGKILSVAQMQSSDSFANVKDLTHEVVDMIERQREKKDEVTGVATGLTDIDKQTAGLQRGDLIILAARPSQGKTALALNMVEHAVLHPKNPVPTAVFSLEMSKHAIMTRFIATRARADLHKVRNGFFERSRWADLTNAAQAFSESDLYIDDTSILSVLELRTRARRLSTELRSKGKELGLVVVDYLQLMRGSSSRSESRQQEVSDISRGLKGLARDLNVPVLALSQLSRRTEDKGRSDARPQLSDLRDSGALEQDADVVAFIYRESYYKPHETDEEFKRKAEVIIAKQRNGPTGIVELVFNRNITRFDNKTFIPEPDEGIEEAQVSFAS
jgi:replicative DNA helicase